MFFHTTIIRDNIIHKLRKHLKIYKSKCLEPKFLEVINQSGKNIVGCIYIHPCILNGFNIFLLSLNTLHVMFYTYIYYWNTFQCVYSLKRPANYYCRICTISCMIFKKNMFMEALCRPLFTKYTHCKPLLPFQINS